MEGPSLSLAAEQLKPFRKKTVVSVAGNTKIAKERMQGKTANDIFSWGKHLVIQFDAFALRTHFMLFGTFEAEVEGVFVTGDYRKAREPRLRLTFPNGTISMYNCSVKFIESANAKAQYDFAIDIMSPAWDRAQALARLRAQPDAEIADVLLDQDAFAGVGNIIKNEVLSIAYTNPKTRVKDLEPPKQEEVADTARAFSEQFLEWRRAFELRRHLLVHQKGTCPHCGGKLIREKTGRRARWSYWCPHCQPLVRTVPAPKPKKKAKSAKA